MASSAPAGKPELLLNEEEDPEDRSMPMAEPALWRRRGPVALTAIAVFAVAAIALFTSHRSGRGVLPGGVVVDGVTMLDEVSAEDDPCSGYPHLHLKKVIHNNLGGHGPDGDAEGIVYDAAALVPGQEEVPCHVKINAEGPYTPWPGMNSGMHGFYGSIVLKSGFSVKLLISVVDLEGEPMQVDQASLTFFDLDHDQDDKSIESITVGGMQKVILSEHTQVVTSVNSDGTKTFTATKVGTGEDNPSNPLTLNQEQRDRAVTLDFVGVSKIPVTLHTTAGEGPRVFIFVGRPSLKCAQGTHYKGAAAGQHPAMMLVTALASLAFVYGS